MKPDMYRSFRRAVSCLAALALNFYAASPQHFEPSWQSLRKHQVPAWFNNAKLGIFIHWGPYSVPGWAPPEGTYGQMDFTDFLHRNPYAEWYLNSLRLVGTPTWSYHRTKYGKDFSYYNFVPIFESESAKWKPDDWADLFKSVGARYVVLTTKHHDGYTLWPTKVHNPHLPTDRQASRRDLVGELTHAVTARGMRMGLYYSGGRDWSFTQEPYGQAHHEPREYVDTEEYAHFTDAHLRELIAFYGPSILWDDIPIQKRESCQKSSLTTITGFRTASSTTGSQRNGPISPHRSTVLTTRSHRRNGRRIEGSVIRSDTTAQKAQRIC